MQRQRLFRTGIIAAIGFVAHGIAALAAQPRTTDELLQGLETRAASATTAEKSALYYALALASADNDPARSRAYAEQARATARTAVEALRADERTAWAVQRMSDHREALRLARVGEARAAELRDVDGQADFLALAALSQSNTGDHPGAVETIQRALALVDKVSDTRRQLLVYNTAGVAFWNAWNPDEAMVYQRKCFEVAEAAGDWAWSATAQTGIGNVLAGLKKYPEAEAAYKAALATRAKLGGLASLRSEGDLNINLAVVYVDAGRPLDAIPHGRRAVEIHERTGAKHNLANAHKALARGLRDAGFLDEAVVEMKRGFVIAQTLNAPTMLGWFYTETAILHEKRGEFPQALEMERKAAATRLNHINQTTRARVEELRERFDAEARERDLALLRQKDSLFAAQLERTWWQRLGLGASLLLMACITAAIIWRQRLILRTKNRVLAETLAGKKAAEEADRMKTRLLGIAAHDIKAPLATVSHLVQALREDLALADVKDARMLLDIIQRQVRRVIGHARDFLDLAAIESGRLRLALAPTDVAAIARTVVEEQRWHAEVKAQTLAFAGADSENTRVHGDAERLHQLITNLVDNALKFSPRGAVTRVAVRCTDTHVQVAVSDQGPGLSLDSLRRLFTPFEPLAARPTGGESSHGYGLSIAMEIARLHGGRLTAESLPDEGATFTLELPVHGSPTNESIRSGRIAVPA